MIAEVASLLILKIIITAIPKEQIILLMVVQE